jgi:protein-disulfide isomerase
VSEPRDLADPRREIRKSGIVLEIKMRLPRNFAIAASFCSLLGFFGAAHASASASEFTPAQKEEIGAVIKEYLIKNPEVLREAIDALNEHDKQAAAQAQQSVVADQSGRLFSSSNQANIGNPKGTATLVEFFDYNCHFCKGALPDISRLLKDDPDLKLVLKDFPVLGPGSVEAANVATAVRKQLQGDKFWQFHTKLLGNHGPVAKAEALAVAREMGVDMDKLAKDMSSPNAEAGIIEVAHLADALQITGTPSFVVGQEVVIGAVGYDQLKEKLDSVHKCGHAVC